MQKDDMIVVTGAAGFIGSNLVRNLNEQGFTNIVLVDDLTDGHKFQNIKDLQFSSYLDKSEFLEWFTQDAMRITDWLQPEESIDCEVKFVFHMGACSSTTEWNGKKMMDENYKFTTDLMMVCQNANVPFAYASSASVYGNGGGKYADPLNVYAFSKLATDRAVIRMLQEHALATRDKEIAERMSGGIEQEELTDLQQIVGLRFFNVYGPNETHKKNQASPVHKFSLEYKETNAINVFDVEAQRDFVHVDDVCAVLLWFMENPNVGIFDVGTGEARSFRDVANVIINHDPQEGAYIKTIDFPKELEGHYQYHTQANLEPLRAVGCDHVFMSLEEGVDRFLNE